MTHLLYLVSIMLFCGPCLLILWKRDRRVLKKYELVLLIMLGVSVPVSFADYYAIRWQAWAYNPATTLNLHLPGEVETYFFSAAVTLIIASATLILARRVDLRHPPKVTHRRATAKRKPRGSRPVLKPALRAK